jgi:5'-3' exonuclease
MGIPSYYKKLADYTKGLVTKSYEGKAQALFFDFNCLIYHCARRSNSTLPPYPGTDRNQEWEALLLIDIVKYITKIWQDVGQPPEVFFAVDGVVPMAKIKQQRMRRFKSVWLAEEEKKEGIRDNVPTWDTNCITPGTAFMGKLTKTLQAMCAKHAHWSVSGAEEPGEGEHKVMQKLRERKAGADPVLIYGLDADLILLTLLNSKSPAYLVRESSEMGQVQLNSFGEEDFSYFSVEVLKKTLPPSLDTVSYVAAMSLLGNDFLPHSLTVKIKANGHAILLKTLESLDMPFVVDNGGILQINQEALLLIVRQWAQQESSFLTQNLKKKLQMRGGSEQTLENRPLEWNVEQGLVHKSSEGWVLDPSWYSTYNHTWLQCQRSSDVFQVCGEYIFGLQWVLDYYTGQRPVNMLWCFSRLLPSLWSDLVLYLEQGRSEIPILHESAPIQPFEQLAMVLPLASWHLVQTPSLRSLPSMLPQFWPETFGFFSVGRIRLWECEALVPVLTVDRIRSAVKQREERSALK